jgi:hypothetical protein
MGTTDRPRRRMGRCLGPAALLLSCMVIAAAACAPPGTAPAGTSAGASPAPSASIDGSPERTLALPTKWPFATEPGLSPEVPPPVLP